MLANLVFYYDVKEGWNLRGHSSVTSIRILLVCFDSPSRNVLIENLVSFVDRALANILLCSVLGLTLHTRKSARSHGWVIKLELFSWHTSTLMCDLDLRQAIHLSRGMTPGVRPCCLHLKDYSSRKNIIPSGFYLFKKNIMRILKIISVEDFELFQ